MTSIIASGVGTVQRSEIVHPEQGRPFLAVLVVLAPRTYNGKTYSQKVQVRRYHREPQQLESELAALTPGTLAHFAGEATAFVEEWKGKHYGNVRVVGTITPEHPVEIQQRQPVQPKAQAAAAAPVQPVEDDDLPF